MPDLDSDYGILVIIGTLIAGLVLVRIVQMLGRRRRERKTWAKSLEWADKNTERRIHHEKVAPLGDASNRRVGFRRKKKRRKKEDRRVEERRQAQEDSSPEDNQRVRNRRQQERRTSDDRRGLKRRDRDRE